MTVKIRQERKTGRNVVDESRERIREVYRTGDRVLCSFSGGKDSSVVMELAAPIALEFGKKLDVVMRDEEILLPGSYEYAERIASRDDINFHWLIGGQAIPNVYNREQPYWWAFDQELSPEQWVRRPPDIARWVPGQWLAGIISTDIFPVEDGQKLVCLTGMRANESSLRRAGLHSSGHYMTKHPSGSVHEGGTVGHNSAYLARVIYDWEDGDVWRALSEFKWDYSNSYNLMFRMGQNPKRLRSASPTMNHHGIEELKFASQIWPAWFDRVCARVPGIRTAVQFGLRSVRPSRHMGETWQECYERTCIADAPAWVAERATKVMNVVTRFHAGHATTPYPEVASCMRCPGGTKSWKQLCHAMFMGDTYSEKQGFVKAMDSTYFRPDYAPFPPTIPGCTIADLPL